MATDDEYLPSEVLRYGTYICLEFSPESDPAILARAEIPALAKHLHLENEFAGPPSHESIAFLRRHAATPGDIPDEGVSQADCVIHVAARSSRTIRSFCLGARRLLQPFANFRILEGVVRPRTYSGAAMEQWAYARAVAQLHGSIMPNAFLIPMSKISTWWTKDWLERSTYFLPRYDTKGRRDQGAYEVDGAGPDERQAVRGVILLVEDEGDVARPLGERPAAFQELIGHALEGHRVVLIPPRRCDGRAEPRRRR